MTTRDAEGGNPAIVALSENDTKLLEQLKTRFKRTITWNKCRSQMTVQPQNNNLNYIINPKCTDVNRLFVLSFQRIAGENKTTKDHRDSFSRCYVPNARIKDFNGLTDGKSLFDLLVKNEEKAYKKIVEISNNNNCTTDNLLDYVYFRKNYKLIAIDLSKQT